jgi:hypothetical protein
MPLKTTVNRKGSLYWYFQAFIEPVAFFNLAPMELLPIWGARQFWGWGYNKKTIIVPVVNAGNRESQVC